MAGPSPQLVVREVRYRNQSLGARLAELLHRMRRARRASAILLLASVFLRVAHADAAGPVEQRGADGHAGCFSFGYGGSPAAAALARALCIGQLPLLGIGNGCHRRCAGPHAIAIDVLDCRHSESAGSPRIERRVTPRPPPRRTRRTRCRLPRIVEAHARPSPAGWLDRPLHWRETLLPAHRVQITNRPHNYGFTRAQSHAPSARRSSCRKLSVNLK